MMDWRINGMTKTRWKLRKKSIMQYGINILSHQKIIWWLYFTQNTERM
jgi:hypothetical protein